MTTATAVRPGPAPAPPRPRRGGGRRETLVLRVATGLIALHVLDDTVLQPPAGTSPRLVSALVPLALLGLAGWAYPRLPGAGRGALALVLGLLGLAAGSEAFHYTREVGPSGDDFTGLATIPAALALIGLGAVTLWRTRRVEGGHMWRYARRGLLAVAGALTLALVLFPIGLGYVTTHVGRAVVPPDHLGVPHENVTFTTADGLELKGWYVPSRNGAAVIVFPGRSGPQKQTRMLIRHGYGALLFDRRGEGESEGAPNAWGWGGGKDIEAAIRYLQRRPDVQPGRIGGLGLSVGGEMMIETAADTDAMAAVISEGAGSRSIREDLDMEVPTAQTVLGITLPVLKTASIAVSAGQLPPENLKALAARVDRPMLLIAAPNSGVGEELNRGYHAAAGDASTLWEIPESGHVGGLAARPAEYERRVVGFLDAALLR